MSGLKSMRKEVADNARVVGVVFVPAKEVVRVEGDLRGSPEPAEPIQVLFVSGWIDGVSPFAVFRVIPAIGPLTPNQRAEFTGFDPFGGLVPFGIHAALGADHVGLSGFLGGIVNLECFREIAGHRFLAKDVFTRFHGIDADLGVPIVDGGDDNGIYILAFKEFAVVAVGIGVLEGGVLARLVQIFLVEIAHGDLGDVIVLSELFLQLNVLHALFACAHIGDVNAIVCAQNPAGGWSLVLAVNGCFEESSGTCGRGEGGRFSKKIPA